MKKHLGSDVPQGERYLLGVKQTETVMFGAVTASLQALTYLLYNGLTSKVIWQA